MAMRLFRTMLIAAVTVLAGAGAATAHDGRGDRWDRGDHWDRGERWGGRDHRPDRWDHGHRHRGPSISFSYRSGPSPFWYGPPLYRPYPYAAAPYSGAYFSYRPGRVIIWSVLPLFVYDRLGPRGRGYHERAYERAMSGPVGNQIIWNDGNDRGAVRITREGRAGDRACREFQQDVTIGGELQSAYGTACQNPDGTWALVEGQ
jgi:hypothetical protein